MSGLEAGDRDEAIAVTGVSAVVGANGRAVFIGDMEHRAGQRGLIGALLQDGQGAVPLIPEGELLDLAALNQDILGCAVQHESIYCLDFPCGNGSTRLQAVQHDFARVICIINAIVRAYRRAAAVHHLEGDTGQGLILCALDVLMDNERGAGLIVENQAVGHAGAHHNILRRLIQNESCGSTAFRHHDGGVGLQTSDRHGPIAPGDVPAIVGAHRFALTVPDQELRAFQGLLGNGIPLEDGEGAEGIVIEPEGLGVPGIDNDSLGRGVLAVKIGRFFLCHHECSRLYLGEYDLAVHIGGVEAVGAGHALIVRHQLAVGVGDTELRSRQRLLGHAVIFLHNQGALGGVGDNDRLCIPVGADDHVGAGGVHHVA